MNLSNSDMDYFLVNSKCIIHTEVLYVCLFFFSKDFSDTQQQTVPIYFQTSFYTDTYPLCDTILNPCATRTQNPMLGT